MRRLRDVEDAKTFLERMTGKIGMVQDNADPCNLQQAEAELARLEEAMDKLEAKVFSDPCVYTEGTPI